MPNADNRLSVVYSESSDVYANLALEELLLLERDIESPVLLFYRNSPAIVIGKHQNPWLECNTALLAELNIPLARRISGGGTVYHDPGNLNYAVILPREIYDRQATLGLVVSALGHLGLQAELRAKSSVFANGKKVSGSAFCFKRGKVLHHGTLLIDAELDLLKRLLQPALATIDTNAIRSVPAPVANLSELKPGVDWRRCARAVANAFEDEWKMSVSETAAESVLAAVAVRKLTEARMSAEWVYGNTPKFALRCRIGADAEMEAILHFDRGNVVQVESGNGQMLPNEAVFGLMGAACDKIMDSGLELF